MVGTDVDVLSSVGLDELEDAVALVDSAGIVLAGNAALYAAFARGHGSLVGVPLDAVVERCDGGSVDDAVGAAREHAWRGEVRRRGADDADGLWDVRCSPVAWPFGAGRVVAVFRDVTARHAAERERLALLGTVSHDVKGALTVILGYSELLADPDVQAPWPQVLETLGRIHQCGEQIHALIVNFTMFARLEAGILRPVLQPLDVADMVERLVPQFEERARRRGVAIEATCGRLPAVSADRAHVERILANLVINAIAHAASGGRVVVTAARDGDDRVRIAVSDDGAGFSSAALADAFTWYRRGPRVRRGDGVGLGLCVARGLARLHGGDVAIEPTPAGATVVLRLPCVPSAAPARD